MVKNTSEEKRCKICAEYAEIQTDYGVVRRCKEYKSLLEETHVEKERPKWCQKTGGEHEE